MTPDGHNAHPLDKAAIREPFVNVRKGRFPRRAEFGKPCIYGLTATRGAPALSKRQGPRTSL
jgi:hypothetical protein